MKIVKESDFLELNRKLMVVESYYEASIQYIEGLADRLKDGHYTRDNVRDILKEHAEWCRGNGGPKSLENIRDEFIKRGVFQKGLRY